MPSQLFSSSVKLFCSALNSPASHCRHSRSRLPQVIIFSQPSRLFSVCSPLSLHASPARANQGLAVVTKVPNLTITDTTPPIFDGDHNVVGLTSSVHGDSEAVNSNGEEDETSKTKDNDATSAKGSMATPKNIYWVKGEDDEYTWVDECPEDIKNAAENEETDKFALIVRNKKSQDSRRAVEADSIVINSPWLKDALGHILENYPSVTCNLHRLVFDAPFKPFVHRWSNFIGYMKREDLDATAKEHLVLLFQVLKQEIGNEIKEFEDYVLNGVVTYGSLWMIFQPGRVMLSEHQGALSAFEFVETEYKKTLTGQHVLQLSADCVDWDGSKFGRYREEICIPQFSGTKKITTLNAYPLSFSPHKEKLEADLIERGQQFEELAGHKYKAYEGQAITWDHQDNEKHIHVAGRIIVDTKSFNRFSDQDERRTESFNDKDLEMISKYQEALPSDGTADSLINSSKSVTDSLGLTNSNAQKPLKLTPYHHMLCRSRVRGYSLKTKKWLELFVSAVRPITWDAHAFENLVLPSERKETVLAFSESQLLNRAAFDDVISGKGKGIIMLLSGPPGVGKTLTAEAVAEFMHCPLHSLTSGDLGSSAYEIERELNRTLELVARWNAILLIDECDVFLEARAAHDHARNEIVSIFLRTLEYYEGIMFMTTNRADNIDPAFQSRIHVSLQYPDLSPASRRQIWAAFLERSEHPSELGERDLEELSRVKLNGRQIKNVLKTAQLLALRRKSSLGRGLVETVLGMQSGAESGRVGCGFSAPAA